MSPLKVRLCIILHLLICTITVGSVKGQKNSKHGECVTPTDSKDSEGGDDDSGEECEHEQGESDSEGLNSSKLMIAYGVLIAVIAISVFIKLGLMIYRKRHRYRDPSGRSQPATPQVIYTLPTARNVRMTRLNEGQIIHIHGRDDGSPPGPVEFIIPAPNAPISGIDVFPPEYNSIVKEDKTGDFELWELPPPYNPDTMNI